MRWALLVACATQHGTGRRGSLFNTTERACAEVRARVPQSISEDAEEIIFMTCPRRAEQFNRFGRERELREDRVM